MNACKLNWLGAFVAALTLITRDVPAQGTIAFINNASTLITFLQGLGGGPVPAGYNVGLWWGVEGTAASSLTLIAITTTAAPGRFVGGNVTTPPATPGGAMATFQIRALGGWLCHL